MTTSYKLHIDPLDEITETNELNPKSVSSVPLSDRGKSATLPSLRSFRGTRGDVTFPWKVAREKEIAEMKALIENLERGPEAGR